MSYRVPVLEGLSFSDPGDNFGNIFKTGKIFGRFVELFVTSKMCFWKWGFSNICYTFCGAHGIVFELGSAIIFSSKFDMF
jgi:hypothetical protein